MSSASVVRAGTAVEITSASGKRLVRGLELGRQIGRVQLGDIKSARLIDEQTLEVTLASGSEATVDLERTRGADLVITNATLLTCDGSPKAPLGQQVDGALIVGDGRIRWRGQVSDLASAAESLSIDLESDQIGIIDARGRLVSPGLIDCHTHLPFGGSRDEEFAMRAAGAGYQEIAAAGGGIASTRTMTLDLDLAAHSSAACGRLEEALGHGTTTLEAKSGYALTLDGELGLLEACLVADSIHDVDVIPTLLGAHVVPPEHKGSREAYVELVAAEMVPAAAAKGLCTSVDVYCDEGAFTLEETRKILTAAKEANLDVRAHVGQFADLGGPQLLAELGALSADHLEEISPDGIAALAAAGVVAVMLPAACVQLRQAPPPIEAFRRAGVAMAVASDMNPGSSYCESLAVPMWLAATHYGMTVDEVWLGVTRRAAQALGRTDIGTLAVGGLADLVVWECERPSEVPYRIGKNLVHQVIKRGRRIVG